MKFGIRDEPLIRRPKYHARLQPKKPSATSLWDRHRDSIPAYYKVLASCYDFDV